MRRVAPRMVSLTITFYHEGVFVGPPLEYLEGNKDTMKDLDFGNFTYGKFFECIKAATLFPPVGLFYCLPGSDLSDGIRELKNEQQLADFRINDEDECVLDDISSFVEEPQFIGEEEVIISNRCTSDPFLNRLCKTDPKKTTRNTFGTNEGNENALALVEDEQEDQSVDPIYKIKPGIVYPDHDPDQHWKDMVPILGMKFKDHEEMKMMLANYGVANGYQLWYKRNDYKSLLVLCGRNVEEGRCASKVGRNGIQKNVSKASKGKEKVEEGKGKEKVVVGNKKWTKQAIKLSKSPSKKGTKRKTSDNLCKFRLWGSWMQNEASFQIKTLIPDHNCARVFNFGALVTYKWIARHYVREIVSNPKISHRELQAAIREKFLINVSLGQVRRAKQRALYDFEGGLIEHYGKLWDYRDQLLKTNPGSTVKFDVDEVSGGKTYFKRFYVCFKAMKDGWTAGCRKVIGLDGCFLKGTINGELLTAMGRGGNVKEGRCASKVGRKGKGKEKVAEGKGKEKVAKGSKVAEGNKKWTKQEIKLSKSPSKKGTKKKTSDNFCKFRVFDFGALVTYKWIARHYVKEIVSNPKISHKELQAAIRKKFLINVSLGQVRRAKQRALYDFEGRLIEHYGKLWDYRDQLLKTNPGSNVKLDIEEVLGAKTYFRRFYVCFKG
ncbi:hypothetical protein Tco_1490737 [Tanacetum coccineum]